MDNMEILYVIPENKSGKASHPDIQSKKLIVIRLAEDESTAIDEMFHKMMIAIQIKLDLDIAIFRLNKRTESLESKDWISKEKKQHVLVFGISPEKIGLQINHLAYTPVHLYQSTIIFCHTLEAIHFDVNLKKRLWNALKQQFQ